LSPLAIPAVLAATLAVAVNEMGKRDLPRASRTDLPRRWPPPATKLPLPSDALQVARLTIVLVDGGTPAPQDVPGQAANRDSLAAAFRRG
jgi:hypothetical protein